MSLNRSIVDKIAAAVMYEGYILYPYRPSIKNRQRWTFGGVYPQTYVDAGAAESCSIQTECLLKSDLKAAVNIRARFLHLIDRTLGELSEPSEFWPENSDPRYRPVETLLVGSRVFHHWQEAAEREILFDRLTLKTCISSPQLKHFAFPLNRWLEPIRGDSRVVGLMVREQRELCGSIEVAAAPISDNVFKIRVSIKNETSLECAQKVTREEVQLQSFASTHLILSVMDGEFVSQIDPPDDLRAAAAGCSNHGAWPVLVGDDGQRDTMLAAPIILYDYPQIAAESPGDLFDATEIDEILTLRIQTLSDKEKREIESVEEVARALLQRTDSLSSEALTGLHGMLRPAPVITGGFSV